MVWLVLRIVNSRQLLIPVLLLKLNRVDRKRLLRRRSLLGILLLLGSARVRRLVDHRYVVYDLACLSRRKLLIRALQVGRLDLIVVCLTLPQE